MKKVSEHKHIWQIAGNLFFIGYITAYFVVTFKLIKVMGFTLDKCGFWDAFFSKILIAAVVLCVFAIIYTKVTEIFITNKP